MLNCWPIWNKVSALSLKRLLFCHFWKWCKFLLSETDSIAYYEERGKSRIADAQNKIMSDEFNKLNRVSQIEFMHMFNDFKDELAQFLEQFAREGKVVKRENVLEFFDGLNDKRKRRKVDAENSAGNTYFCK